MQSLRSAISDIITDLRSYDLDDKYSYRFLANKLKGNIENFFKQDVVDRTILKINDLWKPLHNVRLKQARDASVNAYFDDPQVAVKSIHRIPDAYNCKYGTLIKVMNLNNSLEYIQIKPFEYKDINNREYPSRKVKYYWIDDGYLYIPNSETDEVKIYGLFKDSQEADLFNGNVDCCYKPLDSILLVPDYLLTISKKQVVLDLLQEKQIPPDENPNLNSNEK